MIQKSVLLSFLLFLFSGYASAKVTQVNYDMSFGIFGTIGTLKTKLTKKVKTYEIDTKLNVTGLAKYLMDNHTERHISKGHMENGLMVSDLYQTIQEYGNTIVSKEYWIDHKSKNITKRYKKWKNGKLVTDKKETLKFYAKDDLLTLYFNLDVAIKGKGKKYLFKAVGLEKQEGEVQITVPSKSEISSYKKDLGETADWYAKALIYQKNFRKKKGDILLSVGKDGIIKKAVIKDVLLYGDAKIKRVK